MKTKQIIKDISYFAAALYASGVFIRGFSEYCKYNSENEYYWLVNATNMEKLKDAENKRDMAIAKAVNGQMSHDECVKYVNAYWKAQGKFSEEFNQPLRAREKYHDALKQIHKSWYGIKLTQ